MAAVAAAVDPMALAEFEAGLDGLAENDLVDEAEVDSIMRETVLHTIGDTPWTDSKVGRACWVLLPTGPVCTAATLHDELSYKTCACI